MPIKACRIQVHKSLFNVVLLDQMPDHISERVSSYYPAQKRRKNGAAAIVFWRSDGLGG
jgi:hypothetical protein